MFEGRAESFKLQQACQLPSIFPTLRKFSMPQVISYFVEAIVDDLNLKGDFNSLRESSFQMFRAGELPEILYSAHAFPALGCH